MIDIQTLTAIAHFQREAILAKQEGIIRIFSILIRASLGFGCTAFWA